MEAQIGQVTVLLEVLSHILCLSEPMLKQSQELQIFIMQILRIYLESDAFLQMERSLRGVPSVPKNSRYFQR